MDVDTVHINIFGHPDVSGHPASTGKTLLPPKSFHPFHQSRSGRLDGGYLRPSNLSSRLGLVAVVEVKAYKLIL